MSRREFLMQGKVYDPDKHDISGFWASEKLDGIRCYWDGGLTRGVPTAQVPWAGVINPKTGTLKSRLKPMATGLWSRYGNPVMAPDWFLNMLPCCPLDGELYKGRGKFQETLSTVRKNTPIDEEWKGVSFAVFGCPNLWDTMQDGQVKNANMVCNIHLETVKKFLATVPGHEDWAHLESNNELPFSAEIANLNSWLDSSCGQVYLIKQTKLPLDKDKSYEMAMEMAKEVIKGGGEGLILRDPQSVWTPKKVASVLKIKSCLDDEGTLVGFTSGRVTDKGSRLLGKIGALVLDYKGNRLEISGLTYEERELASEYDRSVALASPGQDVHVQSKVFKLGDTITFRYRELSQGGVPKDARFDRIRWTKQQGAE